VEAVSAVAVPLPPQQLVKLDKSIQAVVQELVQETKLLVQEVLVELQVVLA